MIRFLLLGLSDYEIASALHMSQFRWQQRVSRIMTRTRTVSRVEMIERLFCDPQFVPWLRFIRRSPAGGDHEGQATYGIRNLPDYLNDIHES